MQFPPARPDVVRAISQRWLLKFWNDHLCGHRVPCWQSVKAENLNALSQTLSLLDVIGGTDGLRFLIRFHGGTVAQIYGADDCRGKFLDEVIVPSARAAALLSYHRTVEGRSPVYTIHDLTDRQGRVVHYERLLLPFARDGHTVDRILVSFELVCPDGAFDAAALLQSQQGPFVPRLSATIKTQALV
jgi:hypothetical protein